MKGFTKLALVSAIAALPMTGFAMEALDDAAMSDVTGQDGITLTINVPALAMDVAIHDNDGFAAATNAGAIVIDNMTLATGAGGITAVIDAGDNAGVPILNVAVSIPSGTVINTGALSVATSNGMGSAVTNQSGTILSPMSITLGAVDMNIQLGNEQQTVAGVGGGTVTQMIALNTSIVGGITLTNFAINDASVGGGAIGAASILINGNGGPLGVVAGVNTTATGLEIGIGTLGTATGLSVQITDAYLGAPANVIGDVEITGLNLNGTTIAVSGH